MEFFIKNFSNFIIIRLSKFYSEDLTNKDFLSDMYENIKKGNVVNMHLMSFFLQLTPKI